MEGIHSVVNAPIVKTAAAWAAALVPATLPPLADSVIQTVSTLDVVLNALGINSWADVAAALAAIYSCLLTLEFIYKLIARWIKQRNEDKAK